MIHPWKFGSDLLNRPMRCSVFFALATSLAAPVLAQTPAGAPALAPAMARAAAAHPQPGDRIVVHIVGEPLLSDTVMVSERGDAPFPKLGLLPVTTLSTSALQDTLQGRYARYLRTPAVELVVLRRVSVGGEVTRPNVYFVDVATTLRELISRAGGTTESAKRDKVWIVRQGQRIAVPQWESDESVTSDLRSGDQVIVGRRSWLSLNALSAVGAVGVLGSLLLALRR